jgi:hypothetical protein
LAEPETPENGKNKFVNIGKQIFGRKLVDFDIPDFDVAVLATGGDRLVVQPGHRVDLKLD